MAVVRKGGAHRPAAGCLPCLIWTGAGVAPYYDRQVWRGAFPFQPRSVAVSEGFLEGT